MKDAMIASLGVVLACVVAVVLWGIVWLFMPAPPSCQCKELEAEVQRLKLRLEDKR